jgi:REP element-mobilizing transposase RayT
MADRLPPVTEALTIRRAHLPHWQAGGSTYFVTFRSTRGDLPPAARQVVVEHIRFDCGRRFDLVIAVVMPDHVHLIFCPRQMCEGVWFDLSDILKGLKGASARRINLLLGTSGAVWQQESYDRIVRDDREFEETVQYVVDNPVKAGLVTTPEEYPFFVYGER